MKSKFKLEHLLILFFICSIGQNIQGSEPVISKNMPINKKKSSPFPKDRFKKFTKDDIWERHYEIYVTSDPDLIEPGFGSYDFGVSCEIRYAYSPGPSIVGGMEAVYNKLRLPSTLINAGIKANLTIMVYIEANGTASSARIMNYYSKCKFYEFEKAACDVVKELKFKPAMLNGKPTSSQLYITIDFTPLDKFEDNNFDSTQAKNILYGLPVDPPYPVLQGCWEEIANKAIKVSNNTAQGASIFKAYIDSSGKVLDVKRIMSYRDKHGKRDDIAIDIIKSIPFKPAMLQGKIPIGAWFNFPIFYSVK